MAYQWATWLADVLRGAGVPVYEEPGWKTRGRPDGIWTPRGPMVHHDASPKGETSHGADVIINGRPGLAGPLGNLWLAYDGTWHVIAAGRANHAGEGQFGAIPRDQGNSYCIGIETDHTTDEKWSDPQRSSALLGVAALCDHLGIRTEQGLRDWFCAHKEYAAGRKVDPDPLDMDHARAQLLGVGTQEGFMDRIEKTCTTSQMVEVHAWTTLQVGTGSSPAPWGILTGPCEYVLDVHVTAVGKDKAGGFLLRAINTQGNPNNQTRGNPPSAGLFHGDDDTENHFTLSSQGSVPEGQWLNVAAYSDSRVKITRVDSRVTVW